MPFVAFLGDDELIAISILLLLIPASQYYYAVPLHLVELGFKS